MEKLGKQFNFLDSFEEVENSISPKQVINIVSTNV